MNIPKTLLITLLAGLISMPVYAHNYDYYGHPGYSKSVENKHKGHHKKQYRHDRGHHYGWYKRPYGLYKKHHHWNRKPYYGYRDYGYGHLSDDGWQLILKLSDDF